MQPTVVCSQSDLRAVFSALAYPLGCKPFANHLPSIVLTCKIAIMNFSIGHGCSSAFSSGDTIVKTQQNATDSNEH